MRATITTMVSNNDDIYLDCHMDFDVAVDFAVYFISESNEDCYIVTSDTRVTNGYKSIELVGEINDETIITVNVREQEIF